MGSLSRLGISKLENRYPLNPITPPMIFLLVRPQRREIAQPWLNPPTNIRLQMSPSTFCCFQNQYYYWTFLSTIAKLYLTSLREHRSSSDTFYLGSKLRALISYQLGHFIPPLMVTGLMGAWSSFILPPLWSGDQGRVKQSRKPADESPNPWSQIREKNGLSGFKMIVLSASLRTLKAFFIYYSLIVSWQQQKGGQAMI